MSQFEFNLATQEDDAALRELLAATPMYGDIELAFAREPSYFAASAVDGHFVQVITARHKKTQQIIGMGSRAVSPHYVNGKVQNVGYLSALRLLPEYRGKAALLARGYRLFHELHSDGRTPYYLTTIAADNLPALETLTSGRAGLPTYHSLGKFHTFTLSTSVASQERRDITVRKATPADGKQIFEYIHQEGPRRQFFPSYEACEFFASPRRLLEINSDSFFLAHVNKRLVGTLGLWDQRSFKQNVVHEYSTRLKLTRPIYNGVARLRARPILPAIGESFNLRYAAVPVVAENDPHVAECLLHAGVTDLRKQGGDFMAIGLHENDPLLPIIKPFSGREYVTLIYLVFWPDSKPDIELLTDRVPYLELGCL